MNSIHKKTKKISLFLLIIIVLFIIALIFTIINFFSSTRALSEYKDNDSKNIDIQVSVDSNNKTNNTENIINDLINFIDISNNISTNNSSTFILNNHTFNFNNSENVSIIDDSNKSALKILNSNSDTTIILNTDNTINFNTLKNTPSLKDYLESKYNISITSDIKAGTIKNLNIIIFTISDDNKMAYFVINPLNDSELIYSKIYNNSDMSTLINDLSQPLDEISSIINNSIN